MLYFEFVYIMEALLNFTILQFYWQLLCIVGFEFISLFLFKSIITVFPSVSSPSKYLASGFDGEIETTTALTVAFCLGVLIVLRDMACSWWDIFFICFGGLLTAAFEKSNALFAINFNYSLYLRVQT